MIQTLKDSLAKSAAPKDLYTEQDWRVLLGQFRTVLELETQNKDVSDFKLKNSTSMEVSEILSELQNRVLRMQEFSDGTIEFSKLGDLFDEFGVGNTDVLEDIEPPKKEYSVESAKSVLETSIDRVLELEFGSKSDKSPEYLNSYVTELLLISEDVHDVYKFIAYSEGVDTTHLISDIARFNSVKDAAFDGLAEKLKEVASLPDNGLAETSELREPKYERKCSVNADQTLC
jgi:hypothetical protein